MHLTFRNVNEAFRTIISMVKNDDLGYDRSESRNGPVLRLRGPVTITYTHPRERVLFNQARDCNPFFHLYESLWMLAGRNDVAPLAYYNSKMAQFSDDGKTFNGAYGYRWRHAFGGIKSWQEQQGGYMMDNPQLIIKTQLKETDQLPIIIDHLKRNPTSRRAVLHMSNVRDDLLKTDTTKDQCCNLCVCFDLREKDEQVCIGDISSDNWPTSKLNYVLDMTVFNRSNDTILGMFGANVVHFSILHEYMANCIGVEVGHYHQVSNNMHIYTEHPSYRLEDYLRDSTPEYYSLQAPYGEYKQVKNIPKMVKDQETFDKEVQEFVERHKKSALWGQYQEPFLATVAQPMCIAFHHHKQRNYSSALSVMRNVASDDWRIAGTMWIKKRQKMWEERNK